MSPGERRAITRLVSDSLMMALAMAVTLIVVQTAVATRGKVPHIPPISGFPFAASNTAEQNAAWKDKFQLDMTYAHQARPAGLPSYWTWDKGPVLGAGNHCPHGYRAITMWGQVYEAAPGPGVAVPGIRVELLDPQLWIYSKSQAKWIEMQSSAGVQGAHFFQTLKDNRHFPADTKTEPDGGTSVSMISGYNFHYWPTSKRVAIKPSDIGGITTAIQAKLVPTNPVAALQMSKAKYIVNVGADYWPSTTASSGPVGVMEGRFTYATDSYQWYTADTQFGSHKAP